MGSYDEAGSAARNRWDKTHEHYTRSGISYDDWLESFDEALLGCQTPIIDLGCGSGNDTLYLLERGKQVVPCDYSENAILNIRKNFPEIQRAECFDMAEGLPFPDHFTEIVIADLSLHYFSESVTVKILGEIKRVLRPEGLLLFRVNSINDFNHGAGQGQEIERNFYYTDDFGYKRFFDENDIRNFFDGWDILLMKEETMGRYDKPKVLWRCAIKVIK